MSKNISCNIDLYRLLTKKSAAKVEVFNHMKTVMSMWKEVLEELASELSTDVCGDNEEIVIEYLDVSTFEAKLRTAGDILFSYVHTNVFALDESHYLHQHSYLKKNEFEGYFGTLNLYYFLGDSIKYNRLNDNGILIARVMVNKSGLFFVEGIRAFGEFDRFDHKRPLNHERMKTLAEMAVKHMLDIDLTLPPRQHAQLLSVGDIQSLRQELRFNTTQRLGFRK
ncbi:MAG: hypothetical protein LAT54_05350 [Cryomorphaceae bacterium]|nr:hypothetical protein [Cryomorphaceae bacterium]